MFYTIKGKWYSFTIFSKCKLDINHFYLDHSSIPCFHSIINPPIKITKRNPPALKFKVDLFSSMGKGRIKTISKSKIKNKIEIKKNWVENVIRLGVKGLNPHSNLMVLSFEFIWNWAKLEKIRGREKIIKIAKEIALIIVIIFF